MTTYYVRVSGDDGNAGTSPAAAWATIGKALGAAGIASGDVCYIGAGTYRECVTVAMTSAVAETFVIGDVDGSKTGDAGEVIWTAYTTDDKTAPSSDSTLNLAGCDYLTLDGLTIIGGSSLYSSCIEATITHTSQYITLRRCTFVGATIDSGIVEWHGDNDTAAHWSIDRCIFVQPFEKPALAFICGQVTGEADIDVDITIDNCLFLLGYNSQALSFAGSSSVKNFGGPVMRGCTCWGGNYVVYYNNKASATYPPRVYNCVFLGCFSSVAGDTGNSIGDYNFTWGTHYWIDSDGGHSVDDNSYAALLQYGQEFLQGRIPRPFLSPMDNSPLLGFGNGAGVSATDFLGRSRPSGGQLTKAVGYMERHDTATKETTVYDATPGIKITGPGDHEFMIPVDASATTISVKARYDAAHDTTNKPQAILLANPAIGVTAETLTMSAAVDTWETLTFAAQTPSAKGVVRVRLVSRSAAANGIAYFDTFNVT